MWFAGVVSGASMLAAACAAPGTTVLDTPEGRVLQYEGDDLLVLVSGLRPSYPVGQPIQVNLLVNNQSASFIQVRLRPKLLGRGDQPVAQPEPVQLDVRSDDAGSVDVSLPLSLNLAPGEYTLTVEIPPWRRDGRDFGRGTTLRAPVRLTAAEPRP